MGIIANMRGGIKYKIRIFHDNYHIKTVTVKAKGQRFVTVVVESPLIGHKEKLAFMIPHEIKPFVFKGKELEFSYDIRDACPLTDLTDLYPEFIEHISADLATLLIPEKSTIEDLYENTVIDVEAKEIKKEEGTADPAEPPKPDSPPPPAPAPVKKENVAVKVTKDSGTLLKEIVRLRLADDIKKQAIVKKIMSLCARHPKLYYWLPKAWEIDMEVIAIVSAKGLFRIGIMPSYYAAQSGALISEKVLERPKEAPSWITVALVGVIGIILVAILFLATRK